MSNSIKMKWTKWRSAEKEVGYTGPAVYRIRMVRNHKPFQIHRFLSVDKRGIFAIGQTVNVENRRKRLKRSLASGRGHAEANLLFLLPNYSRLKKVYKGYAVEYSFAKVRSKKAAERRERDLLKRYVKQFGEVPPLNSVIPYRYDQESWRSSR